MIYCDNCSMLRRYRNYMKCLFESNSFLKYAVPVFHNYKVIKKSECWSH